MNHAIGKDTRSWFHSLMLIIFDFKGRSCSLSHLCGIGPVTSFRHNSSNRSTYALGTITTAWNPGQVVTGSIDVRHHEPIDTERQPNLTDGYILDVAQLDSNVLAELAADGQTVLVPQPSDDLSTGMHLKTISCLLLSMPALSYRVIAV